MQSETLQQIFDLQELQNAHERRLRVLLMQNAQQGYQTPPATLTEIRDIQNQITTIALQITKLQIATNKEHQREAIAESTNDLTDVALLIQNTADVLRRSQNDMFQFIVTWLETDNKSRSNRTMITNWFYIAVLLLFLLDILIRATR